MSQQVSQSQLLYPVTEADHSHGPSTALVTLLEYGDYQCPHCFQMYPLLIDVQEHFGERLRFVFRHFPVIAIHPEAELAAEAAEAAGAQGRFWEMHGMLFVNQFALKFENLLDYAQRISLDTARFRDDLEAHSYRTRVQEDVHRGKENGVRGTPTFFLNGTRYEGELNLEDLLIAIQNAMLAATPAEQATGFFPHEGI
jgi:protein-disulfide isomerase